MDQSFMVRSGQALVEALDREGFNPEAAVWLLDESIDRWKLWLVPSDHQMSTFEFYGRVGDCMFAHPELDLIVSDARYTPADDKLIVALNRLYQIEGLASRYLRSTMKNGSYIPEGIVLRMNVKQASQAA